MADLVLVWYIGINRLTAIDAYTRHRNSAACYQLAQSVLKIGSALAGGGWVHRSG